MVYFFQANVAFITNIINIISITVIIITIITTFDIDMEIKHLIVISKKQRTYKKVHKWTFSAAEEDLWGRVMREQKSEDHFLISHAVQPLSNDKVV